MSHEEREARSLNDYLQAFNLGAGDLALPSLPSPIITTPVLMPAATTTTLIDRLPNAYLRSAEATELRLVTAGLFGNRPAPPVPPPTTAETWTGTVRSAAVQTDALQRQVEALRAPASRKTARTEHVDAHIINDYSWLQYRIPSSGACDPAQLVWLEVWFRARQLLKWIANPPLRGVTGDVALLWARTIERLVAFLVESTNIRFFSVPGTRPVIAGSVDGASGLVGLASRAQARGSYYFGRAGSTAASWEAMQWAPLPQGGYEELAPELARPERNPWIVPRAVSACGTSGVCGPADTGMSERELFNTMFRVWAESGSTSTPTLNVPVQGRRGGAGGTAQFDLGIWIDNLVRRAKIMSDDRVSYQEVLMRSVGYYVNSYLDYGARRGVLPSDVVNNARAQFAAIQSSADAAIQNAVSTGVGVVVAVVTAINAAAGAIVGIVLGILQGIVGEEGAATGTGPTVPYPFYLRVFGGSCMDRSWLPPPVAVGMTSAHASATVTTVYDPTAEEPDTTPPPSSGGKKAALGIGLVAGLWLLLRSK